MDRSRSAPEESTPRPYAERVEDGPDGQWVMRTVPTGGAKTYRCPGCDQAIPPGVPHVVAWSADRPVVGAGPEDRRHWHTSCWRARSSRRPRTQRSRDAPRY
ncbi:MAG: ATP/GTP-binding protein [Actinomycetota bacterium]|nr:ATP/GTP-binding protein [Actinomycetota bacterium]